MLYRFKDYLRNAKKQLFFSITDNGFNREKLMPKCIILIGEPEYENLGDHAIAYATKKYIERNCQGYMFLGIPEKYIKYSFNSVKKAIIDTDILLLQGGGNMGDLYPDQILIRKKIIMAFPHNRIIIMPQTIYFSKNQLTAPLYFSQHKKLVFIAREKVSCDIMKKLFGYNVLLMPDIVLSLMNHMELKPYLKREKALICIRNDRESNGDSEEIQRIIEEQLRAISCGFERMSTIMPYPVDIINRDFVLNSFFDQYQSSKLVITDRLHGMIIAAITKTPCVVLPTFNHKVTSCYEWIKDLNYVEMCCSISKLEYHVNKVLSITEDNKTCLKLDDKFKPLREVILEDKLHETLY